MPKARVMLAGAILAGLFVLPMPAHAYASSCGVYTFSSAGASCTYLAKGEGVYKAYSASGWRIWISRDGEPFKPVLGAQATNCSGVPGGGISQGRVPSEAGDLVKLEITVGCVQLKSPVVTYPSTPLRYELGFISAGDPESQSTPGIGSLPPVPSGPPLTGNPSNSCLAVDPATKAPGATPGAISCSYTAGFTTGEIFQATPNSIVVKVNGTTVYSKGSASLSPSALPNRATFATPIGATVTVTVGPDAAGPVTGAIGFVLIGDSPA